MQVDVLAADRVAALVDDVKTGALEAEVTGGTGHPRRGRALRIVAGTKDERSEAEGLGDGLAAPRRCVHQRLAPRQQDCYQQGEHHQGTDVTSLASCDSRTLPHVAPTRAKDATS